MTMPDTAGLPKTLIEAVVASRLELRAALAAIWDAGPLPGEDTDPWRHANRLRNMAAKALKVDDERHGNP